MNCGGIPETLAGSEFFGYRGGAFTGSDVRDRKGWVETAHNGTLILDEIAELSLDVQPLLLRALQNGEAQKVGGAAVKVDFRLIAITKRSLEEEVEAGRFRRDLYYRIAVIPLRVPPLRERATDIPLLAQHFLDKYRQHNSEIKPRGFTAEAVRALIAYPWPGNVRELQNVTARALVLSAGNDQIEARYLVFERSHDSEAKLNKALIDRLKIVAPGRISISGLAEFLQLKTTGFSSVDYSRRLECSESTARRHLEMLRRAGILTAEGAGKGRRFRKID